LVYNKSFKRVAFCNALNSGLYVIFLRLRLVVGAERKVAVNGNPKWRFAFITYNVMVAFVSVE